ncbi:uncharacterized protein LOC115334667 [Aquila chrysaetos chrysaetos]|uniref:uncharacterized protein LOC115334667 n=1 Tax=Aquila chrysaetos chrysaetos TaxID=223781 RepID=UPI0011770DF0|nr:uncharacterized protein LOC115334667 [Aquila chrysaetos chrysaetos]
MRGCGGAASFPPPSLPPAPLRSPRTHTHTHSHTHTLTHTHSHTDVAQAPPRPPPPPRWLCVPERLLPAWHACPRGRSRGHRWCLSPVPACSPPPPPGFKFTEGTTRERQRARGSPRGRVRGRVRVRVREGRPPPRCLCGPTLVCRRWLRRQADRKGYCASSPFSDELCKTASVYLPNKCSLKNHEDPDGVCMGIPLACTHRLCPQCPIHGRNPLPSALSSSDGQAGRGCRSRRLALGISAAVFLHQDGGHHAWSLAACPSPAWKRPLRSKTCL